MTTDFWLPYGSRKEKLITSHNNTFTTPASFKAWGKDLKSDYFLFIYLLFLKLSTPA